MKRLYAAAMAGAVGACIMSAGCSKLPEREMSAAKAARESAQAAGAPVFAAEKFKAAQELETAALADIKAQNAKSVFARNYEKDQKQFAQAAAAFDSSKAAAAANKATIAREIKELWGKAKAAVEASEKIAKPLIKRKNKAAVALKAKLDGAAASLPADPEKIPDDSLVATRDAIKNSLASLESIKASFEQLAPRKSISKKAPQKKGKR
jgi:hypothetical protein